MIQVLGECWVVFERLAHRVAGYLVDRRQDHIHAALGQAERDAASHSRTHTAHQATFAVPNMAPPDAW
jgi:hypothetical protein